jgi:hypothetical protein
MKEDETKEDEGNEQDDEEEEGEDERHSALLVAEECSSGQPDDSAFLLLYSALVEHLPSRMRGPHEARLGGLLLRWAQGPSAADAYAGLWGSSAVRILWAPSRSIKTPQRCNFESNADGLQRVTLAGCLQTTPPIAPCLGRHFVHS